MKSLLIVLLLFGTAWAQEADSTAIPELFIVVRGDTLTNVSPTDSSRITTLVGDTLVVEFHARNWPEVIGYTIEIGTRNRARGTTTFEPGTFYIDSRLPTTQSGLTQGASSILEIGQVSLGDSKGSGSGHLGNMIAVFTRSGDSEFVIRSAKFITLPDPTVNETVTTALVVGEMKIFTPVDPLEINVTADRNNDGVIGFDDFLTFAAQFGKQSTDLDFDPLADFNGDGSIGFVDFLMLAADFGKPPRVYRVIVRR